MTDQTNDIMQRINAIQAQQEERMRAHRRAVLAQGISIQTATLKAQMENQAMFSNALIRAASQPIRIEL